jgi:hypothetical protein
MSKTPKGPFLQVIQVFLVGIGFPFKTNPVIGLVRISVFNKPYKILEKVPDKKEYNEQLQLLLKVYSLVIHKN